MSTKLVWLNVLATAKGGCIIHRTLYNKTVAKTFKSFLATYPPAGGTIGVVLVREEHTWVAFFCTDINATVRGILEAFADRAAIEHFGLGRRFDGPKELAQRLPGWKSLRRRAQ